MAGAKILTTCDACRLRKVRCLSRRFCLIIVRDLRESNKEVEQHPADSTCINCYRRGDPCRFSRMKRRRTQNQSSGELPLADVDGVGTEGTATVPPRLASADPSPTALTTTPAHAPELTPTPRSVIEQTAAETLHDRLSSQWPKETTPELCIDRILKGGQGVSTRIQQSVVITSNDHVASSTVAFFSESKIRALSSILGHDRLHSVINGLDDALSTKLKGFAGSPVELPAAGSPSTKAEITDEDILHAEAYTESFFQYVNPMYPVLNRREFEKFVSRPDLNDVLVKNVAWKALYYGILALGSMYHNGGSFLPGEGLSWKFFQASLNLMPELLLIRRTIETAQALIVMAIFAQMHASLPVDEIPVNEAARIMISLGFGKRLKGGSGFQNRAKAFWVVYCMEKDFAFNVGRSSLINDCDIVCPLPTPIDDLLGELDWIRAWAAFSRLTSKAYDRLFSVSAALSPSHIYLKHATSILVELEDWKDTLPERFRPGSAIKLHLFNNPVSLTLAVKIRLWYHNLQIAIARLVLHISNGQPIAQQSESKWMLMCAARSIVELTHFMTIEPFTPCWVVLHMPMVAAFILFDLVIHNPSHRETPPNLTYLDVASGFFARMQMTQGADRDISSLMVHLNRMAREHVQPPFQEGSHQHFHRHVEPICRNNNTLNGCQRPNHPDPLVHELQDEQQSDLNPSAYPFNLGGSTDFQIESAVPDPYSGSVESLVFPIDSGFMFNVGAHNSFGLDGSDLRFLGFPDLVE
ncbi:hypothetical protein FE257_013038 [Aspergillus nanangensis]|uniref:Xylanolytic transcriptional activator regulatory domain-containing protein n=1 Tax=Aspergillus nanangensis TaxID=2582783 RepID=A0AAD4CF19_ASPNN|nr:hypothetical protein FE257_013038 [Aspergillus nanangensis]